MPDHRLNSAATALAAITDREETIEADILGAGGVDVAPPVLFFQQLEGLLPRQAAGLGPVMLEHEIDERQSVLEQAQRGGRIDRPAIPAR